MSTFALVTDDEESRDLGDLARMIQWGVMVVDAALPLISAPTLGGDVAFEVAADVTDAAARTADRAAFRAVAFAAVTRAMTEHTYTARPAVLEALMDGRMPPVEES